MAPPDAPGYTNVVPALPAAGTCRTGQIYSIYVLSPIGDTVAMTVFEPAKLCAGQKYPIVLNAPGFGATRTETLGSPDPSPTEGANVGNNISELVAANFGVITFDQRGFGETTGKIRVMDPDYEGRDYLPILDWAQAKLGWLAFAPTLEGDDSSEPVFGAVGGSYGAMWEYLLVNIDKRHRIRAIVPNASPSNLNYSLFPNDVPKTTLNVLLFVAGTEGTSTGSMQRANFDPFVTETFASDIAADAEDPYARDFFGYHSADYFYNGVTFATNGGAGTMPLTPPTTRPPKVNALIWNGVRDPLFNFNNAYNNYVGLAAGGGDVRLLSYQAGHNALMEAPPDLGADLYYPSNDDLDSRCGSVSSDSAELLWFDQYLKFQAGAAASLPTQPCISLGAGDGVTVPHVTTGTAGVEFPLTAMNVTSGAPVDVPTAQVLYTAPADNIVEAGIPHVHLQVSTTLPVGTGTPIIFLGIGQTHASSSTPTNWDLVDNELTPVRGVGTFDLDLVGGGTRMKKGDQLALLVYGLQDQYAATGSVNVAMPTVEPLTVTGNVWLPMVGSPASI